jgi:RimJ/RimL family protein N-acetyltransferase
MTTPKFLSGDKVFLRALKREDLEGPMQRWSDDSDVTKYMFRGWRPARIEELVSAYEATINSDRDIEFAVCCQKKKDIVGVAGLHEIHWLSRQAEFRIMLGDKSVWGNGFGSETTGLLVGYAFEKLNLNRVWLGVNAEDQGALKCYKNAGFTKEGVLREAIFRNNKYYDAVRMSILRKEYESA